MDNIQFELELKKRINEHCKIVGICSNCNLWGFGCQAEKYYSEKIKKDLDNERI